MQRLALPHRRALSATVVLAAGVGAAATALATGGEPAPSFSRDVQPIFDRACVACHPVAYPYLDLRPGHAYADLYRVSAATNPAFERVVPGKPGLSYVLIHPPDPSNRGLLTPADRGTIAAWIDAGAPEN